MGLSWDEYWNGDPEMLAATRKAFHLQTLHQNRTMWLQGLYIYEALLDASPVYHDFAKHPKPIPYLKEPFALDAEELEARKKRDEEEADKKTQATVRAWVERVNRMKAEKK